MITRSKSGSIKKNDSVEGETIEMKIRRIVENKEPIKDGAPLIYTERSEGVKAGYNIRTDRFEVALDGVDKVNATRNAQREQKAKMEVIKNDGKAEPTGGSAEAK